MPRRARLANAFTRGVLDPNLRERIDLEHYYAGLLEGENVYVIPQGGFRRRGGLRVHKKLRRALAQVQVTQGILSAPNGGTVANAVDGSATTEFRTSSGVTGNPFVIIKVDFGAAQEVAAIDVRDFDVATTGADKTFGWQHSQDDSSWVDFGKKVNLRTAPRCRRFAADPEASAISARYWRLIVAGGGAAGTVGLHQIMFWKTTLQAAARRGMPFTFSRAQTYVVACQGRGADIFRGGDWQAASWLGAGESQIQEITRAQSRDTMLLFHEDVEPVKLLRQGDHDEWNGCPQVFANVPALSSGTGFLGARNEVQRISLDDIANGDTFSLSVGTQASQAITKGEDATQLGTAIINALEATSVLLSGIAVEFVTLNATTCDFLVEFAGSNASRLWPLLGINAVSNTAIAATAAKIEFGTPASGSLMSDATGWPRAGTFYQARLVLGGFKLAPDTTLMSKPGDQFNMNTGGSPAAADDAIQLTLDSEEVNTIHHIFSARHLQFFTDTSEWYVPNRELDATQPTTLVQSTRFGSKEGIPLVSADGGTLFVQLEGNVLRDYLFSDIEQDYGAEAITLLASHLLNDVRGMALRRASKTDDGTLVFLVNGDGTAAVLSFLRKQEVIAMTKITTAGSILDVVVDGSRRIYFLVERTAAGETEHYLEEWDDNYLLDQSIKGSSASPVTVITGLDHLEGEQAYVIGDGSPMGEFPVSGGAVTLTSAVSGWEVGRPFFPRATTMPFREQAPDGEQFRPPARVYDVELSLVDTGDVTVIANASDKFAGDRRNVALRTFGDGLLDVPMLDALFTGTVQVAGLQGVSDDALVTLTQDVPAPLQVRSILSQVIYQ